MELTTENQTRVTEIIKRVGNEFHQKIVGQQKLFRELFTGLISGGHVLIEGVPGLGKTLAAKTLAQCIRGDFKRIQFTPDLLPADITGTLVYRQDSGEFIFRKGPVFTNILLADEINRAPGKVQSALLEAMEELQVTAGDKTYPLPSLFFVVATQNPIEHEGTYTLPEAQIDRFFLKSLIGYPGEEEETIITSRHDSTPGKITEATATIEDIEFLHNYCLSIKLHPELLTYIVHLVRATRPLKNGDQESKVQRYLSFGASPRGSIALGVCAKIFAAMDGRTYVIPEDIKEAFFPVLRHRIILSYEAESEGLSPDDVLTQTAETVPVP